MVETNRRLRRKGEMGQTIHWSEVRTRCKYVYFDTCHLKGTGRSRRLTEHVLVKDYAEAWLVPTQQQISLLSSTQMRKMNASRFALSVLSTCLFASAAFVHADITTSHCVAAAPCRLACAQICANNYSKTASPATSSRRGQIVTESTHQTARQPSSVIRMDNIISRVTAVAEHQALAAIHKIGSDRYPVATDPATGSWVTVQPGHW